MAIPINHTDFRHQTAIHNDTRVCVCVYTSAMLLLHLCCDACVMYKHVAYGRKNTLYFHIDTSSCHVRPFNGLFFVERDSDTVEEKQNHRLQVGITGRFLEHDRATELSNLVGYIRYL